MATAVAKAAAAQPMPASDAILQSPLDKREYRRFVLENGMTALLISDPEMAEAVNGAASKDDNAHDSESQVTPNAISKPVTCFCFFIATIITVRFRLQTMLAGMLCGL